MATNVSNIIGLPIFTGLTQKELEDISNDTSFSLIHVKKGAVVAESEAPCNILSFIVQGWIDITTVSDDRTYSITETMQAIHTIEPDKIYGLHKRYRSQYQALTPCEIIVISKDSLQELLSKHLIVRLNFLNMICRKSQQVEHSIWRATNDDIYQRITHFIRARCLYPGGKKVLHITMNQLAKELNASRLEVSNILNDMAKSEKIILKRGIIDIPALQLL